MTTESIGHEGYSWTVEGGIVEVVRAGGSIIRAPLSHPIMPDGRRSGREWWPASDRYEPLWRPLTFATADEANVDMMVAR